MTSVCVIGLGEEGFTLLKRLVDKNDDNLEIFGMDPNQTRVWELRNLGYEVGTEILDCDIKIYFRYYSESERQNEN
jgi:hypothetical protein